MGVRLARKKPRTFLTSLLYRIHRLLPFGAARKLDLYLDLEWLASRLAQEVSFELYPDERHPVRDNRFLLKHVRPGDRVVDLGCATGTIANILSRHAAEVVGIDHDGEAVAAARRLHPHIRFERGDARDYLKAAPRFDVLILSHILEHLDDAEGFLRETAGHFDRIYIEVPDFDASILNRLRLLRGRKLIYQDSDHVSEFDGEELKTLVAGAGLRIVDEDYSLGFIRFWCARS